MFDCVRSPNISRLDRRAQSSLMADASPLKGNLAFLSGFTDSLLLHGPIRTPESTVRVKCLMPKNTTQ